MTIADISSIRVNVWQDMKFDTMSVANATFNYPNPSYYTGPGDDLGFDNAGVGAWIRCANYNPTLPSQGTLICRVRMLFGSQGKAWFCFNGSSNIVLGFTGNSFVLNGTNLVSAFNDVSDTWRIIAGTWGPGGQKGYDGGSLYAFNAAYQSAPGAMSYGVSVGAGMYGAADANGYNNLAYLKMDWAALLNRQLSDAEILDLTTTPSQLWSAAAGGGIPGALARPTRQRCNRVRLVSRR